MAKATDTVDTSGFSSTCRKVLSTDASGNSITDSNPLPVQIAPSSSYDYESKSIAPGTSANGYNVKTTGSMFGTVVTSKETIVKNRTGNSGTITVYLKADNVNPIVLAAGESIIVDKIDIVNLFLDTDSSFGAAENIDIVLFG